MNHTSESLDSIRELNLAYLSVAQRLLKEDSAAAQARLGLSQEMADVLVSLLPAQTLKLASSSQLLCVFRMSDETLLSGLAEKLSSGAIALARMASQEAREQPVVA